MQRIASDDYGLAGAGVPAEYGGLGLHRRALMAIAHGMRGCGSFTVTLEGTYGISMDGLIHRGTDAQRQKWLPLFASGAVRAGFALTEGEAGSDAIGGMRMTAELCHRQETGEP